MNLSLFFFNDTATTEIYTLSLHDALPISQPAPEALAPDREPDRVRPRRRGVALQVRVELADRLLARVAEPGDDAEVGLRREVREVVGERRLGRDVEAVALLVVRHDHDGQDGRNVVARLGRQ